MDILILGNGFDLAHGLRTKYSDFLDYCQNQYYNNRLTYMPTNVFFTNMWIRHFINMQNSIGENWIDIEQDIYKVILNMTNLSIIKNNDCQQLFTINFRDDSFNFYNIKNYLSEPFGKGFLNTGYARCDEHNNISYTVYFASRRGFIDYLYVQLREFAKIFQEYLDNEVLSKLQNPHKYQLSLKTIGVNKGDKNVHVLSFNYTDTCKRLYDQKFNNYCNINIKPIYVHGQVCNSENCNLILGTHSFSNSLQNELGEKINVEFNIFKKHYQRHHYGTIEPYQDLLRKTKKSRSTPIFHIIGHSLDITDKNILKHILLANPDSLINIYYHTEEAQECLMHKIDSIIGEEEVMEKVRFIHQHDPERGILIPIEEPVLVKN